MIALWCEIQRRLRVATAKLCLCVFLFFFCFLFLFYVLFYKTNTANAAFPLNNLYKSTKHKFQDERQNKTAAGQFHMHALIR